MAKLVFVISIFFSLPVAAEDSHFQELKLLFDSHHQSPTFHHWHESKDELETKGLEIWQKNQHKAEFCLATQRLPNPYLYKIKAWSELSPVKCKVFINKKRDKALPVFMRSLQLETCNSKNINNNSLGPSRQVVLNTNGGPRLVTGDLNRCEVAFTFDDGPDPVFTMKLLKSLAKENIQANFFTVGRNVKRYPNVMYAVAEADHIIGNHSYSHKNFPDFNYKIAVQDIVGGFRSILDIWDYTTPFFRFPYGAFTKKTRKFIQKHDVAEFFWNMDTRDWALKDPAALLRNVFKEIDRAKRGILLFHDVHPQTIEVIPEVLVALKKAGYTTAVFLPEELIEGDFPDERKNFNN